MSELVRVSHGLWRPSEQVAELAGRCAAVLDVMPPGTVLADRTAAALAGLWLPTVELDRIEVVVRRPAEHPRQLPGSRRVEIVARRRILRADEICMVRGLPATTESRTWIDLCEFLDIVDLVACGDSVLRGPHAAGLAEAVLRARGRRGVRKARAVFDLLDGRSRSRAESHLRYAIVGAGLPTPEVNTTIRTAHGEWLAEPDLHYRGAKLTIEYNGAAHAGVRRMRRDITRAIDVEWDGWHTAVFGPAEVFGRPWMIGPFLRAVLDRIAPGFLREWRESQRVARHSAPLAG